MSLEQIIPAIFLIAVLIMVLPRFIQTNRKSKQFLKNLFIWSIIVVSVVLVSYLIFLDEKINLAITGCMGRMGQQIIRSAKQNKSFKIVTLTESEEIKKKLMELKIKVNSEQSFKRANLIIDFTIPKCTLQILRIASKLKKG